MQTILVAIKDAHRRRTVVQAVREAQPGAGIREVSTLEDIPSLVQAVQPDVLITALDSERHATLRRLHEAGVHGVKFHNEYQNFFVDDEAAMPLYEACAARGLIMLFHGGADRGFAPPADLAGKRREVKTAPARMRRVAGRFPGAKIVVAHLGGQDMLEDAVTFLADTGVYIDTSFASRTVSPADGAAVVRAFGAGRVLFGTDCPWDTPQNTVAWVESLGLSSQEKELVYFRNALRLLG